MMRPIFFCAAVAAILVWSASVDAQGRRPAGSGAGGRASISQQHDQRAMRQQAELRRQEAEARRLAAEAKRQEAEQRKAEADSRRDAAQENNRSDEARAEHPPNEHAADEAFLADENAENQNLRDQRPALGGNNRGDHGRQTDDDAT